MPVTEEGPPRQAPGQEIHCAGGHPEELALVAGERASFLGVSDSLARLSFGLFLAGGHGHPSASAGLGLHMNSGSHSVTPPHSLPL